MEHSDIEPARRCVNYSLTLEAAESRTLERELWMETAESRSRPFSNGVRPSTLSARQPSRLSVTGTLQVPYTSWNSSSNFNWP